MPARKRPHLPVSRTPWLDRMNDCYQRTGFKQMPYSGGGWLNDRSYENWPEVADRNPGATP